ncbi:MAG: GTPase, partial [Georgenia sp.]
DGLEDVTVLTTSALRGTGIDDVRRHLAAAVGQPSAGARTAAAEVDAVCRRLSASVGAVETEITADAVAATAGELLRTAGADSVADSVRTALSGADGAAVGRPEPPALPSVAAARDGWIARYQQGLPVRWAQAVAGAVAEPAVLAGAVGDAVTGVEVPTRSTRARNLLLGGIALAVVSLAYLVLALVTGAHWWPDGVLVGVGLVAAVVLLTRVGPVRRAEATELADSYRARVDERVVAVTGELLVEPTVAVLDRHHRLRAAIGR